MKQILPTWTTVGFTGHRDLENPQAVSEAIRIALDELSIAHCPLAVVCSAAKGADTLLLQEVARRNLPYFLVLPFTIDHFQRDFEMVDWELVAAHFPGALDIEEVRGVETRNEAYLECGIRTVDRSDVLLAVWNGEKAAAEGGTGDIVDYARSSKKPLIWINSLTCELKRERMELLQAGREGAVDASITVDMKERVPQYKSVSRQYHMFSRIAKHDAPWSRQLIQLIIWLHLFASALGITASVLEFSDNGERLVGASELGVLCFALWLAHRRQRSHHEWMHVRVGAEVCRSFLSCWRMRRRGGELPVLLVSDQNDLVRSLRMAWYLDCESEQPLFAARDKYLSRRVEHQIRYFNRQYKTAGNRGARLMVTANFITIAAIILGAISLALSPNVYEDWSFKAVKLTAMLLMLLPPAILSLVVAHDLSRRAERYNEITAKLRTAKDRLKVVRSWPGLWREVCRCENLLLQEVVEWNAITRFAAESD